MTHRTNPRPVNIVMLTIAAFVVAACPPLAVVLALVAVLSYVIRRNDRRSAQRAAQWQAHQRWQRDVVLAAKSLP
jgi:type IV secretory pathway VirB3-like protein